MRGVLTADACEPSARTGATRQNTPAPPESEDLSAVARAMASAMPMEVDTPQAAHSKMGQAPVARMPSSRLSARFGQLPHGVLAELTARLCLDGRLCLDS